MKRIRSKSGPFSERPHFEPSEIDQICAEELRKQELYPSSPGAIRIDRFVEKRFGIVPQYEILPDGFWGFTKFAKKGVEAIVIAAAFDAEKGIFAERGPHLLMKPDTDYCTHTYSHTMKTPFTFSTRTAAPIIKFFAGMSKERNGRSRPMTAAGGNFRQIGRWAAFCVPDHWCGRRSNHFLRRVVPSAR